ncbi:trigger factor [Peptostreptococcaceae bacterium oral taxon 929]|uniref:trigger factor n=1 Tax=Fenollaria massiliensis TaxID=938288 RepID=UPI00036E3A9D|nr:trigger factor [Fenollaria massiliensis]AVM66467.1 trigger factor [Peptostreptococcaceae bacterium oral taxon 929]
MKVNFDKKEKNKVYFNVDVDWKEFEPKIDEAYKKMRSKFNIPGFRKGKVPKMIIEQNYGVQVFYDEAINICLQEIYPKALEELDLKVVDQPDVDVKDFKENEKINFTFEVEVVPEFELPNFEEMEVEDVKEEFDKEVVTNEIERLRNENARYTIVEDRKTKKGDIVKLDFKGYVNNEAFQGGEAKDYELEIGSNSFIPGFEDQLIDRAIGEEFDVNVKFPEEYHAEDLKGKDAKFICKINEIKVKELPELDDNFASDVSEFDTLKEFKADLRKKLKAQFNEMVDTQRENKVLDKVIEETKFDVPNRMIEDEVENELRNFQYRLQAQGLNYDDYKKYTGKTDDEIKETFKEPAEKRVKLGLILEKYAKDNKIKATKRDYDKELDKLAEMYKAEDKEEFKKSMSEGSLEFLDRGILNSKSIDDIKKKVKYI